MSLRVLTLVWDRFPEGGSKLLTMLALADWGGDDGGRIYPSIETLSSKIRMSERQTIRVLHELAADLWITNLTPENLGGRGRKSRFKINIETLTDCPLLYRKRSHGAPVDNSDPGQKETLTNATINPDKLSVNSDTISPESETTSQNSRQPLKNRYKNRAYGSDQPVDKSLNWESPEIQKIETLRRYISQMQRLPFADNPEMVTEIDRAKAELAGYLPPPKQPDLLAPGSGE